MANFKVHARVLDLLGEEQIADCPTAMSELFKNAYDAYANNVSLDVYSEHDAAVLWDDGIGMSEEDVLTRWLVVGTPGKKGVNTQNSAPLGFDLRPVMGEKGIGRLAISTLGDTLLLLTKKSDIYTALLINWNIVRNDRLLLSDIEVPVRTFSLISELDNLLTEMIDEFLKPILSKEADKIWNGYSKFRESIKEQLESFRLSTTAIKYSGIENRENGTIFFIRNLASDLPLYVTPPNRDDSDKDSPQALLVQLLASFQKRNHDISKSFDENDIFKADVRTWDGIQKTFRSVFSDWNTFNEDDLSAADHHIKIEFDENGRYFGHIRRYDEVISIPLGSIVTSLDVSCGPFSLEFWYWQGEDGSTRLNSDQKANINAKLKLFGGILLYRDNLRVLPYGRPEFDWLKMEERRSFKASRAFFSYRRMFGSVSIARESNPFLRDKAGREGLKSNKEYRDFRKAIINFLTEIARDYFGESIEFKQKKAEVEAHNQLLQKEEKKVANKRKKLKEDLESRLLKLEESESRLKFILNSALQNISIHAKNHNENGIVQANIEFERKIAQIEDGIRFVIPANLSIGKIGNLRKLKYNYEEALPKFRALCAEIRSEFSTSIKVAMPDVAASAYRKRAIDNALFKSKTRIGKAYAEAVGDVEAVQSLIQADFEEKKSSYLTSIDAKLLELTYAENLQQAQSSKFGDMIEISGALENLSAQADAEIREYGDRLAEHLTRFIEEEDLITAQSDEIEELKEQVGQNLELVQLGLSVEIIDHDLQKAYRGIKGNLSQLQKLLRSAPKSLILISELRANFQHLEQRYQLMSPLYRNSYRRKTDISGEKIFEYISMFLQHELSIHDVRLEATAEFLNLQIHEVPGRILPVFINVVDNAIYWTRDAEMRLIKLDFLDGVMVICDTGAGIHPTMLSNIFKPFYSGKPSGRGLGLYIARANLAIAGHEIWASLEQPYKKLSGACICINLKTNDTKIGI